MREKYARDEEEEIGDAESWQGARCKRKDECLPAKLRCVPQGECMRCARNWRPWRTRHRRKRGCMLQGRSSSAQDQHSIWTWQEAIRGRLQKGGQPGASVRKKPWLGVRLIPIRVHLTRPVETTRSRVDKRLISITICKKVGTMVVLYCQDVGRRFGEHLILYISC